MGPEQATADAADLAERILEEISSADQNWGAVEHMATALAELAAHVAPRATARRAGADAP